MNVYDFHVRQMNGKELDLSVYRGNVLLIVNTASKCGFTPQFEDLEKLFQKYRDHGFMVLGFPCNQFHEQDPESNDKIAEFCRYNYGVTFPMLAKTNVKGPQKMCIRDSPMTLPRAIVAKSSISLLLNVLLNTFWMVVLYGKSFTALFPVRLTKNLMLLPVEIALLYIIGKTVQKISRRIFAV